MAPERQAATPHLQNLTPREAIARWPLRWTIAFALGASAILWMAIFWGGTMLLSALSFAAPQ